MANLILAAEGPAAGEWSALYNGMMASGAAASWGERHLPGAGRESHDNYQEPTNERSAAQWIPNIWSTIPTGTDPSPLILVWR